MRKMLIAVAVLCSTAAMAQDASAPKVGDKPLVQVKPKPKAAGKPSSVAAGVQACLDVEDGTKARLDCYDAVVKPSPKPKPPAAKGVLDCRFIKEEDERLTCFNGFAESIPKFR
jgi:hypothetical protein